MEKHMLGAHSMHAKITAPICNLHGSFPDTPWLKISRVKNRIIAR
jgi:hypothetical protein